MQALDRERALKISDMTVLDKNPRSLFQIEVSKVFGQFRVQVGPRFAVRCVINSVRRFRTLRSIRPACTSMHRATSGRATLLATVLNEADLLELTRTVI